MLGKLESINAQFSETLDRAAIRRCELIEKSISIGANSPCDVLAATRRRMSDRRTISTSTSSLVRWVFPTERVPVTLFPFAGGPTTSV